MQRKKSLFFSLNDRSYGVRPRGEIRRNILGSNYLVNRLKCEHVFVGHEGCVNSVAWSECGDILLSGSDDCKLNIYRLNSMKPVHSIQSGHRANVFSAKFLPCTGNTKIVSCSGDGILHYNDVNSPSFYGKNPFCCHAGTTYEVNTTPTEPHTFLSSGEDGTVRLFDLRSKTKCLCEGCREDVLIDCEKAVTSFSVNPVYPYYIAVGCENSMLRIYDRRSLSTDGQGQGSQHNKHHGLLYQFKPKTLEQRHCRVTSLKYSSDGQSLLASFCSDYVYLFDASPNPPTRVHSGSNSNDERDGSCPHAGNDPPMKRLRLRGDWSDTGPNARPECEDSGTSTSENNFVQRMSGYLTRWIEESLQNTRSQRNDPSTVRVRPEEGPEEVLERSIHRDENPEASTAHDSGGDSLSEDDDRGEQETDAATENDVMQETEINSGNLEQDGAQTQTCSDSTDVEHMEQPCPPRGSYKNGGKACAHGPSDVTPGEHSVTSTDIGGRTKSSESSTKRSRVTRRNKRGSAKHSDEIRTESTVSEPSSGPVLTSVVNNHGNSKRREDEREDNSNQELFVKTDTPHVLRTEELSLGTAEAGSETHHPEVDSPESNFRTQESMLAETREPAIQESETDVQSSGTRTRDGPSTSGEASVGESSESEDDDDDDSDTRRNAAASTIQNFFRFRYKKDSVSNPCGVPVISEARQIFKGHRNARTMIKEANFWGDDFVLSGSDCGRIFIWSRHTAELVMLLEGDRHVVNCVQPHPYDPILATSGIDYDVKLWTPTALNGSRMDNANEIIARNEKMLKESRDTLTVPASFMIRVLSSLHRVRFNATGNDQTAADSDSDWDEDE